MADIVNLNRVRKAKQKAEKSAKAAVNRTRFGRTKAEKALDAAERERHAAAVEGAALPPSEPHD